MKRYRWLTIACVAGFVAVAASRADDPALPYEESWESYAPGFSPIGTNGWYGDTNHCVVTNMTYTWETGRPISGGSPTNVLNFDTENGAITNVFTSSQSNHYETVDTMVQLVASEDEDAARLVITNDTSIKAAYYLNTNGRLVVYCSLYDGGAGFTNAFWVLEDVVDTVESGDWARVSIEFDFLSDEDLGNTFFRISLNGETYSNAVAFVDPSNVSLEDPAYVGTWFVAANTDTAFSRYLSSVSIHGTGRLDDYVVQDELLAQMRTIMASVNDVRGGKYWTAASGGSEVPGSFQIADGGSTSIWLIAEPHWLVGSITTNMVALDSPDARTNEIMLANVGGDITVYAELVAETTEVATGTNVPNWWLVEYFPDTNDFSEVVHYDDGDGMEAWEEYFTGTIPTNALSFFAMDTFGDSGTGWTVTWNWNCDDVADTNLPDYIVQRATNLLEADPWTDLEPTVPRSLGKLYYTDTNPPVADQVFYRIFAPIPE